VYAENLIRVDEVRLKVDCQHEFGGLLDRQIARLLVIQDSSAIELQVRRTVAVRLAP
jgi:hypothetical protein